MKTMLALALFAVLIASSLAAGETGANIIRNPSAEDVIQKGKRKGKPVDWGFYGGCGNGDWGVSDDAADGAHSVFVRIRSFLKVPSKGNVEMVQLALIAGRSGGYSGKHAYPARPNTTYAISYWFKTDCPAHAKARVIAWKSETAGSKDREYYGIKAKVVEKKGDWHKWEGTFRTSADACRFVPSFLIGGTKSAAFTGGTLYVDKVEVYPLLDVGVYRSSGTLGADAVLASLRMAPEMRADYFTRLELNDMLKFRAVIFPDTKTLGISRSPLWAEAIQRYVRECGGAVLFYHDSVGYVRSPFGRESLFPEIALGAEAADKETSWPNPYSVIVSDIQHPITQGLELNKAYPLMYVDIITIKAGPGGRVLLRSPKGAPALTVGKAGKGLVAFNGTVIYDRSGKQYASDSETGTLVAVGIDREVLLNTLRWFRDASTSVPAADVEKSLTELAAKERDRAGERLVVLPEPLHLSVEEGEIELFSGGQPKALLVIPDDADSRIRAGAESLAAKVADLGGRIEVKHASAVSDTEAQHPLILLSTRDSNPLVKPLLKDPQALLKGLGPQGYVIECRKTRAGQDVILGIGTDAQGVMYAAYTLRWLIRAHDGRVSAVRATVRDKPDIPRRALTLTAVFKGDGVDRLPERVSRAKRWIDWYGRFKLNVIFAGRVRQLRDLPQDTRQRFIDAYREIIEYAHTRGIAVVLMADSRGWIKTPSPCQHGYCFSDSDVVAVRQREYAILAGIRPDAWWFHAHDGNFHAVEKVFEERCETCRKRFRTRAQMNAYTDNLIYKAFRDLDPKAKLIFCDIPYQSNPEAPGKEAEKAYWTEFARLTPRESLMFLRELAASALTGYWNVTGRKQVIYQAHYSHFDSRNYAIPSVWCVRYHNWYHKTEFSNAAALCYLWRAGYTGDMPAAHLAAVANELFGPTAGPHMADVLGPDFLMANKQFLQGATSAITGRVEFDAQDLSERIAACQDAAAALNKAEQADDAPDPEYLKETVAYLREHLQMQSEWYALCKVRKGNRAAYPAALDRVAEKLKTRENAPHWHKFSRPFLRTVAAERKRMGGKGAK